MYMYAVLLASQIWWSVLLMFLAWERTHFLLAVLLASCSLQVHVECAMY